MKRVHSRPGRSVEERTPLGPAADPWISSNGVVAHPSAPRGGGGQQGGFAGPAPLGLNTDPWAEVAHPQSPAVLNVDPADITDKAEQLQQVQQLPAPVVTVEQKQVVAGIEMTVLVDRNGVSGVSTAHTSIQYDAGVRPEVETDEAGTKVTKVIGPPPKITARIQTSYASGANPNGKSAYGRGTTADDKKTGNTSLGFHESCHRKDHLDFPKSNPPPKFSGVAQMTVNQWKEAFEAYQNAVETYQAKSDENSEKRTDEVGDPTRSAYLKKNP